MTSGPFTSVEGGIIAAPLTGPDTDRLARIEAKLDAFMEDHDRRLDRIETMVDHGMKGFMIIALGAIFVSIEEFFRSGKSQLRDWIHEFR